jgi:hypothetical protein
MTFNDLLADCQANASAFKLITSVQSLEHGEDPFEVLGINS